MDENHLLDIKDEINNDDEEIIDLTNIHKNNNTKIQEN